MKPQAKEFGGSHKVPLRVLFFEDHPLDVDLAIRTLNSEEFRVEADVTITIHDLIRHARSKTYDVVLSDYRMPDATGTDAFQGLRAIGIDTPFILVTGSLGDEQAVECLKEGIADYVLKDRLARLPVAVRRALDERRRARERAEAVEELNQFFALSPDMLGIAGLDGRIRQLNPTWERVLGISVAELKSRPFLDFVDTDDRPQALMAAQKLQAGEEVEGTELRFHTPNAGCRWLIFNATPLPQHGLVFIAARDISDRKHLEESLRQQNLELAESKQRVLAADRMKSEFLANMSHELRSPLNGIIGFSQLLFDGKLGPVSDIQKDAVGRVLSSSEHLLHLINGVLDLSKVEAGRLEFHPEVVSIADVVHEVTGALSTSAEAKQIRLETAIAPDVLQVVADSARLKQILYNYLSNALKFTAEGGRVTVSLRAEGSNQFCLEVIDTGVGISPEDIKTIFVEFHQLDSGKAKRFQGTGLGLALTKRIVEAQGGTVGVRSVPGQGSTFFAILPRIPPTASENISPALERAGLTHSGDLNHGREFHLGRGR